MGYLATDCEERRSGADSMRLGESNSDVDRRFWGDKWMDGWWVFISRVRTVN